MYVFVVFISETIKFSFKLKCYKLIDKCIFKYGVVEADLFKYKACLCDQNLVNINKRTKIYMNKKSFIIAILYC